ncbi:2,4-dienoyl-CoA reductase-like NADH-dependent reductase (Old Yellow Enzyme family) [Labedella gwakjiensis]|uniref:2,4-dienoyl-CoA reductase-like NADH-dependent reductase (Old Yellow Enzyme family) n=1 Tax=Labedella gwakjiensis TaxID=390269 RepID=A0A2P8H026_9MICO|nr:alkene reductase [Labedella gwakjiensis]PSL39573.1 2,4-dienoyl-CoA reductase-like NADH-dependent reductase (Old Yellow Enzyme family) [Labedella gwakjiensis]RUQ86031.1 alkene reductase [Labedella gwakjiensis]
MNLYAPLTAGELSLPNRVVMAPLTRVRSHANGVPSDLNVEHYAQRAGLGLIISEGTYPSAESKSYPGQPGIATEEQAAGWSRVAEAVHEAGGRIVMQIMNGGRVSHTDITGTERIVAPSAIAIDGEVRTPSGKSAYPVPHALTTEELSVVRDEFVAAARRAIDAGLDGVEVHGANGYLLHEFLSPAANRREDAYGGSPAARASFVVEVVRAVADEIGAGRVGLRLSPAHNIQDIAETDADDVRATYTAVVEGIAPLGLSYLSVLHAEPTGELVQELRSRFGGVLIANSGFGTVTTKAEAERLVAEGSADAVAVGRLAIANPDLVERWRGGHPENEPNPATFYGDDATGYTDYPRLSA